MASKFSFGLRQLGAVGLVLFGVAVLYGLGRLGDGGANAPRALPSSAQPEPASASAALPPPPVHHYVLADNGRYGYERKLSDADLKMGSAAKPLMMLAYNGIQGGRHQLMSIDDGDLQSPSPQLIVTYEWAPGDEFISTATFTRLKFRDKEFTRATPGTIIYAAMLDAKNGMLDRYVHHRGSPKPMWVHCDQGKQCLGERIK